MGRNIIPGKPEKIEMELVCRNGLSPYVMLAECLKTEDAAIIEQAWLCFAEFCPDHMIG